MRSNLKGWKRLGFSLSLVWVLAVCALSAYEWFHLPRSAGYFVDAAIEKTGEPYLALKDNAFADLVPVVPKLKLGALLVALIAPVIALWLLGALSFWVLSGFKREES